MILLYQAYQSNYLLYRKLSNIFSWDKKSYFKYFFLLIIYVFNKSNRIIVNLASMSTLTGKSKTELTHEELEKLEKEEFEHGPLNILTASVKNNTQVLINCRFDL